MLRSGIPISGCAINNHPSATPHSLHSVPHLGCSAGSIDIHPSYSNSQVDLASVLRSWVYFSFSGLPIPFPRHSLPSNPLSITCHQVTPSQGVPHILLDCHVTLEAHWLLTPYCSTSPYCGTSFYDSTIPLGRYHQSIVRPNRELYCSLPIVLYF